MVQVTVFVVHLPASQIGVGQSLPIGIACVPTAEPQSALLQQAAHVVPQHKRPPLAQIPGLFTQVCLLRSQESWVQSLLSSHCASLVHWMQPPLAGSHVGVAAGQRVLSGLCEQMPLLQVSVVHEIMSLLQSASPQQVLQPSAQHFMPSAQPLSTHLPLVQAAV